MSADSEYPPVLTKTRKKEILDSLTLEDKKVSIMDYIREKKNKKQPAREPLGFEKGKK